MPGIVAVFVASGWLDRGRLQQWIKQLDPGWLVLITDDPSDSNHVLARQCKCSDFVHAQFRLPGTMRSPLELDKARKQRDLYMALVANRIVDFGEIPGGSQRFEGRQVEVIKER